MRNIGPASIALLILMAGCTVTTGAPAQGTAAEARHAPRPAPDTAPRNQLDGTSWRLALLGASPAPAPATLRFAGTEFEGMGPCNPYGGRYAMSGSALSFDNLIVSQAACEGIVGERLWLRALGQVRRAAVGQGHLMLLDEEGQLLAVLDRTP